MNIGHWGNCSKDLEDGILRDPRNRHETINVRRADKGDITVATTRPTAGCAHHKGREKWKYIQSRSSPVSMIHPGLGAKKTLLRSVYMREKLLMVASCLLN